MSVDAMTIAGASVFGLFVGQLTVGIPLSRALTRAQEPRRHRTLPDLADVILDDWPEDRAAAMLAAWDNP